MAVGGWCHCSCKCIVQGQREELCFLPSTWVTVGGSQSGLILASQAVLSGNCRAQYCPCVRGAWELGIFPYALYTCGMDLKPLGDWHAFGACCLPKNLSPP